MPIEIVDPGSSRPGLRIIQSGRTEPEIVRNANEDASSAEVKAGISSCVVHLCGCK